MNDLKQELDCALELAEAAGAVILEKRHASLQNVREKSGNEGPVTEADLAADALIRKGLKSAFPNDTVITEETWGGTDILPQKERLWFIDPLDGTSDFARGGPDYVVMIGFCVKTQPVMGVVYHPVSRTFWWGSHSSDQEGATAFKRREGKKTQLKVRAFQEEQAAVLVSRSHPSKTVDALLRELRLHERITRGSVGLKGGAIAEGEGDVYMSATNKIKVWDTCAPQAILEASGGKMTGLLGAPLSYAKAAAHPVGVLAGSAAAHRHYLPLIERQWALRKA